MGQVQWKKGDIFEPAYWRHLLKGGDTVAISVGAFGSNKFMEQVCGDGPLVAVKEASKADVGRVVFVSAQKAAGVPNWFLPGYFEGKVKVEQQLRRDFHDNHLILQPGFVTGRRHVCLFSGHNVILPLGIFQFAPFSPSLIQYLEHIPLAGQAFIPPTPVDRMAEVAFPLNKAGACGTLDSWHILTCKTGGN